MQKEYIQDLSVEFEAQIDPHDFVLEKVQRKLLAENISYGWHTIGNTLNITFSFRFPRYRAMREAAKVIRLFQGCPDIMQVTAGGLEKAHDYKRNTEKI